MLNKEIEKLLDCNNCKFATCEQCEISYTDKKKIREYIEQLEKENKDLKKRQNSLMLSKEETENMKAYFNECITKDAVYEDDLTLSFMKIAIEYIEQLESEYTEELNERYCYEEEYKIYIDRVQELERELNKENNRCAKLAIENKEMQSREQKLTKLLLEYKKELTEELKYNFTKKEARVQLILIDTILEIVKGEKNELSS